MATTVWDLDALRDALLNAYNREGFAQMLTLTMADQLEDITTANGFDAQVQHVIDHYNRKGTLGKFVLQAWRENPGNDALSNYMYSHVFRTERIHTSPDRGSRVYRDESSLEKEVASLKALLIGPYGGNGLNAEFKKMRAELSSIKEETRAYGTVLEEVSTQMNKFNDQLLEIRRHTRIDAGSRYREEIPLSNLLRIIMAGLSAAGIWAALQFFAGNGG